MISLDSNVLVRYLAQDDVIESARATRLIEDELSQFERGFVTLIVLVETGWVLKRLYKVDERHFPGCDLTRWRPPTWSRTS